MLNSHPMRIEHWELSIGQIFSVLAALRSVNQHTERYRLGDGLRIGLFRSSSRSRTKIRCVHVEIVCLRIVRHGFRSELGLHGLDHGVFIRSVFVEYVDRALACRAG